MKRHSSISNKQTAKSEPEPMQPILESAKTSAGYGYNDVLLNFFFALLIVCALDSYPVSFKLLNHLVGATSADFLLIRLKILSIALFQMLISLNPRRLYSYIPVPEHQMSDSPYSLVRRYGLFLTVQGWCKIPWTGLYLFYGYGMCV